MSGQVGGYAFVILLRDAGVAESLTRYLEKACTQPTGSPCVFVAPPVRGLDFLADAGSQEQLDRWWESAIPEDAEPAYLVMHEEGLPRWLAGIDGRIYVGIEDAAAAELYRGLATVRTLRAEGPLDLAEAVLRDYSGPFAPAIFDEEEANRIAVLNGEHEPGSGAAMPLAEPHGSAPEGAAATEAPPAAPDDRPAPPAPPSHHVPPPAPHPFDLLMSATPPPPAAGSPPAAAVPLPAAAPNAGWPPAPATAPPPGPASAAAVAPDDGGPRWSLPFLRRRREGAEAQRELATVTVNRGSTLVVVGSRKGGVGKTSHAAGVAIVAGDVLDVFGHRAAIVDANIANPDAWGHLNLPPEAATVRDVVAALSSNQEPPPPVHATTPALACYPESREATEYSRTDIAMLAAHLRSRYTFIVVDMSNRLPDPFAGPEAAVAAYWIQHGDVLVLPTGSSKEEFNGVLDFLDLRDRPPTVVPYIVPSARRTRDHPVTRQYLDTIGTRVERIVPIPDEGDTVRYAGMEGVPVEQISSSLREAYRDLLEAIVRVPPRVIA